MFFAHESLIKSIDNDDKVYCHQIFDTLFDFCINQRQYNKQNPTYTRFGKTYSVELEEMLLNIMQQDHYETYQGKYNGRRSSIKTPSISKTEYTSKIINLSLSNLKYVDEVHFDELNLLINRIIIIESNGVNASSFLNMLGLFFLRYFEPSKEHWSRILEHCVHESAHNLLYHIWYQEPVITDDNGTYYTPFRLDYRPLSGVYHAMFVLARTIYAFDSLIQAKFLKENDIKSHYNEANNKILFKEKFRQTVQVIKQSGKLTSFGNRILKDCIELVENCKSSI
ncbi:aKG-HExxH-type peptide beta-hydroxylase [Vibrio hyugaensis]|uniref:aKG-HExxH-type peptide beta-hydroxylase n=1 Tax=Vibrio hyugaensis TaxID=1534743 RepID=UPI0005EE29AD|nr:HEXXH motif-containing putative peptide modification protein [Vibrio hyugaensis]